MFSGFLVPTFGGFRAQRASSTLSSTRQVLHCQRMEGDVAPTQEDLSSADTQAPTRYLEHTPTLKWFPHFTVYECLGYVDGFFSNGVLVVWLGGGVGKGVGERLGRVGEGWGGVGEGLGTGLGRGLGKGSTLGRASLSILRSTVFKEPHKRSLENVARFFSTRTFLKRTDTLSTLDFENSTNDFDTLCV